MKISELIKELETSYEVNGDIDVYINNDTGGICKLSKGEVESSFAYIFYNKPNVIGLNTYDSIFFIGIK